MVGDGRVEESLYQERRQFETAVDFYQRAVRNAPWYVAARSNLAISLTSLGRLDEAIQVLEAGLRATPRVA